jgi:hypothetical protein
MKSLTEDLWFEIKGRRGFNITETVQVVVRRSGVKASFPVQRQRFRAPVFIDDDESGLRRIQ